LKDDNFSFIHSGLAFPWDDFGPEHIRLNDIVHHLSQMCRWGGGTAFPFSVLEHSLYCYGLFGGPSYLRTGPADHHTRLLILCHDFHEAYTWDVATTLKARLPYLKELQDRLDAAIWNRFGIAHPSTGQREIVRRVDEEAKVGEAMALMPQNVYEHLRGDVMVDLAPVSYGTNLHKLRMDFRSLFLRTLELYEEAR
jgi:5'-deoxynucleotidase YfbR-like HD superfamily hydrolase